MNKFSSQTICKNLCGLLLLLAVFNNYAGTIYQAGTVISFAQSVKGSMSLEQLAKHGDYGLGELNTMNGEGMLYKHLTKSNSV